MLQEEHLRRAGLVGEAGLRLLALFAAEGRIGQHDIEELRGASVEQPAVGLAAGERVAVPDVRLVDAVQHEVGEARSDR